METLILSIETSTVPFSVAIARNDEVISVVENANRTELAANITLMIEECTVKANIDLSELSALAISPGPGSYTGLRIGMSVAKGLCFALNIPLIFVSGLKALVSRALLAHRNDINISALLCPALDARRDEVYLEIYDNSLNEILPATAVIMPKELSSLIDGEHSEVVCLGDGGAKLNDQLGPLKYTFLPIYSNAAYMAPLAFQKWQLKEFESVETSEPFYLKPPNITAPKDKSL